MSTTNYPTTLKTSQQTPADQVRDSRAAEITRVTPPETQVGAGGSASAGASTFTAFPGPAVAAPAGRHRTVAARPFATFPFTGVLRSRRPWRGGGPATAARLRLRVVLVGFGIVGVGIIRLVGIGFAVSGHVVTGLVVVALGIVDRGVSGLTVARTVVGFLRLLSSEALGRRFRWGVLAGRVLGIGKAMPAHLGPCARRVDRSSHHPPLLAALYSRRRRCRIGSV